MNNIRFKVAKYALQDVIESLSTESLRDNPEFRNEIYVTKEDGGLVIDCDKVYIHRTEYTCCAPTKIDKE